MALCYRYGDRTRTTMDLDLARQDDEKTAQADLMRALRCDLPDFFLFSAERVGPSAGPDVRSTRYRAVAELDGRQFETIRIDVGFGDPLVTEPEMIHTSALLEFADLEPIHVPALSLEQHVAEKVHAYTRTYRFETVSSRAKDLADLLLIASQDQLRADRLGEAMRRIFEDRGGQTVPALLPPPPDSWRVPYGSLAREIGIEPELGPAHELAARFLGPVLRSKGLWNPEHWAWEDA